MTDTPVCSRPKGKGKELKWLRIQAATTDIWLSFRPALTSEDVVGTQKAIGHFTEPGAVHLASRREICPSLRRRELER
jgi:hypothetical protein